MVLADKKNGMKNFQIFFYLDPELCGDFLIVSLLGEVAAIIVMFCSALGNLATSLEEFATFLASFGSSLGKFEMSELLEIGCSE